MSAIPKLSEAYKNIPARYAKCDRCNTLYIDDLPNYGSVFCPNCITLIDESRPGITPPVLIRGVTLTLVSEGPVRFGEVPGVENG